MFVKKKVGDLRICIDYRRLNGKTFKDSYLLPLPDEVQEILAGAAKFSKLDLNSGYWQCHLDLPMHLVLQENDGFCLTGTGRICFTFVDNILVFSPDISQHRINLSMMLDRIDNAGLTLRGTKCEIGKDEVEYWDTYIQRVA